MTASAATTAFTASHAIAVGLAFLAGCSVGAWLSHMVIARELRRIWRERDPACAHEANRNA